MADSRRDWHSQNEKVILEFRENRGRVGGYFTDKPLLLLTTTGAKTGQLRTNPLGYLPDGGGFVVFGSVVGDSRHPDWYYNLVANPSVTVEVAQRKLEATAVVTSSEERLALLERYSTLHPEWAGYSSRTEREFPVVRLEPVERR
jgi:deazaflavin-dependent oxidoreductase (nitroreductase family)